MRETRFPLAIVAGLFGTFLLNLPIESLAFDNIDNGNKFPVRVFDGDEREVNSNMSRVRRETHAAIISPSPYFIEVAVFVDSTMSKYYKKNLTRHVKMQMAKTSEVFKRLLTERPIYIVVTEILETSEEFATDKNVNIDNIHRNFCKWQHQRRNDSHRYDVGLLLTRKNMNDNLDKKSTSNVKSKVLKGTICKSLEACAVVIDGDYATISTICQVIGRLLNIEYEPRREKKYQRLSEQRDVMNIYQVHVQPLEWSNRSRDEVTKFFHLGNGKCLLDKSEKFIDLSNAPLMGEVYSELDQCHVMGNSSSSLPNRSQYSSRLRDHRCAILWCCLNNSSSIATTYNWPILDGTPCGPGKICYEAKCIDVKDRPKSVDGGWGPWKSSSECSKSCNGGYKILTRQCNNPIPRNGGNYCFGNAEQYEICNTEKCSKKSMASMRQEQCSKFNDDKHQWIADPAEKQCRVSCLLEGTVHRLVDYGLGIDGTPCGHDSSHICINGECKQAGCDNVIDSNAKLDICGICRGDNSTCQRITGRANINHGPRILLNIPMDSFNINIQVSKVDKNGEKITGHKRKLLSIQNNSTQHSEIDYKELTDKHISQPLENDWKIEINLTNTSSLSELIYDFYVPNKQLDKYHWSSFNQDMLRQNFSSNNNCQRKTDGLVVPDGLCSLKQRESHNERENCTGKCNESHWKYSDWSNCSASCGNGTRTRNIWCNSSSNKVSNPYACDYYQIPDTVEICNTMSCRDDELPKVWNVNESCNVYRHVNETWKKISQDWTSEEFSLSKNIEINSQFLFVQYIRYTEKLVNDTREKLSQIISKNEKVSKNDFNKDCFEYAKNNINDVNKIYQGRIEECDEIKLQLKHAIDAKINSTLPENYVEYLEYFCKEGWTTFIKERIDFAKNFTSNYLKKYKKSINSVREEIVKDMVSMIKSRILCYVKIEKILGSLLEDIHSTYDTCLYKTKR